MISLFVHVLVWVCGFESGHSDHIDVISRILCSLHHYLSLASPDACLRFRLRVSPLGRGQVSARLSFALVRLQRGISISEPGLAAVRASRR